MKRRLVVMIVSVLLVGVSGAPGSVRASEPSTAVAAASADDWPQFRQGPAHTGYNASETTISPTNVAELGLAWMGSTGVWIDGSPVVGDGVVYIGSAGKLYAFDVGCGTGGGTCEPLWTGTLGFWETSSPAVADGVVYIASAGSLYAFAAGCGSDGATCPPLWTGALATSISGSIASSPAVANGVVYVGSGHGSLYAFRVGCRSDGGLCPPLWVGPTGTSVQSSPAVADGVVYVGSGNGSLYAFMEGCRSDGGLCPPQWVGRTGASIDSSPAVADGVVYIGSTDGKLYAFAAGCRSDGGHCPALWVGPAGASIDSSPAVANGVVYIGSTEGDRYPDPSLAQLYAFATGCRSDGGLCAPLWTGKIGMWTSSSPAVANGVVYIGSSDSNLYAFATGCRSDAGSCAPSWTWRGNQAIVSSPAVSNGVVYASAGDGNLYAFDLLHGDASPPVITSGPLMGSVVPSTLGQRTTLITWQADDGDGSGIVRYDVEHQRDGGAWIHISSTTATHITRSLKLGHAYRYRVRAYDLAGNIGAWVTSEATVPVLVQGSSSRVKYPVGAWHTQVTAKASGGSSRYSRSTPARATFTFTGRAIAWATSMGPTRGRVDVYVDGAYVTQVDLHLNYTKWQRLLFSASWANRGTHTISLRNSPAGGRIDVDVFVVYK